METCNLLRFVPLLLLLVGGCTSDEQADGDATNEKGEYAVSFSGNMDLVLTKAETEAIGENVKAKIYAYAGSTSDLSSATALASGDYVADGSGNLSGSSSYTMYLPKGSYDFYAVSCNSTATEPPTFTNGTSAVLANGTDYLWVKKTEGIPVSGSTGHTSNVELTFSHSAVNILINVQTDDNTGIELTEWQNTDPAKIKVPATTSCTMTLSSGAIAASSSLATDAVAMNTTAVSSKKATASYIILPYSGNDGLEVTFKVKVKIGNSGDSESSTAVDKEYKATLPVPTGTSNNSGFVGGNQYTYTATLKPNTITFTGAKVSAWTNNDITENLDPTEPEPES